MVKDLVSCANEDGGFIVIERKLKRLLRTPEEIIFLGGAEPLGMHDMGPWRGFISFSWYHEEGFQIMT